MSGDAEFDVVIRGGTIVDGTGMAPYPADVGLSAGRIARIGRIAAAGREEIDAAGHVVTPGFIDGHTHMDAQVFWDPLGTSSCWHGVTTVVMGHCGFTLAPAPFEQRHLVIRNLERAEDISGVAMAAGIDWSWTTFAEYLDAVDQLPKALNYAANVGHSALRTYVMGERAFTESGTVADLAAMQGELADALAAGAIGLSTSRTHHHETSDNRPVASRLAEWDEVCALVEILAEAGTGVFQLVEDPPSLQERAAREARLIDLAVRTQVPIAIGATSGGRSLEVLDAAAAAGGRMFGLTHPRGIGSMSSFRSRLPFDLLEEWAPIRTLPVDEQRRALAEPAVRERLVKAAHEGTYGRAIGAEARKPDFERMRVLDSALPPNPTVADAARERGVDPVELMIDLALATDLKQFFVQTFAPFDAVAVRAAMKHPRTVPTFSDSGAHVSQISDSSIHTHLLGHWVRDRGDFTLEEAVRMLTLAPARAWGFHDRGLLLEGMVADVNVFDPDRVGPAMPELVHDLPAGEPRIEQRAVGFRATVVAGQIVHRDGQHTGALPGRLLRNPAARRPMAAR
ncbi:MAG TPA: amidohydrolase family protein [Frankiaceae bacterium]|nr:amidohydrolase family protein [Frankiaceae bacterium]